MSSDAAMMAGPRGFCAQCGKSLTSETLREVRGVYYCEDCLAERVTGPAPKKEAGSGPALAAILGFVPGLGAIYNGEYFKAILHVLVFGTIIALLVRTEEAALFVPLLVAFILYMPFEAYRTAKAKAEGRVAPSLFGERAGRLPAGPILLIALGVLLLLDEMNLLSLDQITRFFWPLLLIGLGAYLIRKRAQRDSSSEAKGNGQ
jgi:hypothetical protein